MGIIAVLMLLENEYGTEKTPHEARHESIKRLKSQHLKF